MQVAPCYQRHKVLNRYPLVKDDTGNTISLTKMSVMAKAYPDLYVEESYVIWTVLGEKQETWGNGALSYSSYAFWRGEGREKNLLEVEIEGFLIKEEVAGGHHVFRTGYIEEPNDSGVKTKFTLKKL